MWTRYSETSTRQRRNTNKASVHLVAQEKTIAMPHRSWGDKTPESHIMPEHLANYSQRQQILLRRPLTLFLKNYSGVKHHKTCALVYLLLGGRLL